MAKNDKGIEIEKTPAEVAAEARASVDAKETNDKKVAEEKPDLTGLVKMHKEGQHIHAHPEVIKHHESNGWKRG